MNNMRKVFILFFFLANNSITNSQDCEFLSSCLQPYIEPDFKNARVVLLNDLGLDPRWFNANSLSKSKMTTLFDSSEIRDIHSRLISVEEKELQIKCDKIKFVELKKAQKYIYRKKKKLPKNPVFSKTRYYFISNYIQYEEYYIVIFDYSVSRDIYETNMLILKRENEGYKIVLKVGLSAA